MKIAYITDSTVVLPDSIKHHPDIHIVPLYVVKGDTPYKDGIEVDAEVERAKQLTAGMAAEEAVQLPPKDVDALVKKADKQKELEQKGYELRATHEGLDDDSRPRPRHAAPEA